ncbi:MAG: hypothetical protein U0521_11070 [Anaerolineae bacterium]
MSAAGALVRIQETVTSRREYEGVYDERYDLFRRAYQALRPLW